MSKLTLKSVAKTLGVSTATISNAFNRPDQLSVALRQKILQACHELGYFGPNKAAQSLRKGSSGIVAVILSDSLEYMVSDPVASQFLQGVSRELERHRDRLHLRRRHARGESGQRTTPWASGRRFCG